MITISDVNSSIVYVEMPQLAILTHLSSLTVTAEPDVVSQWPINWNAPSADDGKSSNGWIAWPPASEKVGSNSTVTPSTNDAMAVLSKAVSSVSTTDWTVMPGGMASAARTRTLAAVTVHVAAFASSPAAVAMRPQRLVSVVWGKSATVPASVRVTTSDGGETSSSSPDLGLNPK